MLLGGWAAISVGRMEEEEEEEEEEEHPHKISGPMERGEEEGEEQTKRWKSWPWIRNHPKKEITLHSVNLSSIFC